MIPKDSIAHRIRAIRAELPADVTLVAVSKTKPVDMLQQALDADQIDLGENRVQELAEKANHFANQTVRWHHIGHLQTNKVKQVIPHAHLIHAVDSDRLLLEIDKRSRNADVQSAVLLQLHIAEEEQKHGMTEAQLGACLNELVRTPLTNTRICGLMGMATFTEDERQIGKEFQGLRTLYERFNPGDWDTCSMGMSGDYQTAIGLGATHIRVGTALFGPRDNH